MFRNVLVPVDGSEVAIAAVECVSRAVDGDARITLMEVTDSAQRIFAQTTPAGFEFFGAALDPDTVDAVIDAQRQAAEAHLKAAQELLGGAGLTNVQTVIREGLPGDEIVQAVREDGFDLIVMGTHGRSGLFRTVLGSVAEYVVRHVRDVPVLLIHPGPSEEETAERGTAKAASATSAG